MPCASRPIPSKYHWVIEALLPFQVGDEKQVSVQGECLSFLHNVAFFAVGYVQTEGRKFARIQMVGYPIIHAFLHVFEDI